MKKGSTPILAVILFVAGVIHLVKPEVYLKAMPPYLPYHLELIYITGVIELILAVGLLIKTYHYISATLTALYFIAIWPAHFHISINQIPMFGISNPWFLWARTAFQLYLIYWAFMLGRRRKRRP